MSRPLEPGEKLRWGLIVVTVARPLASKRPKSVYVRAEVLDGQPRVRRVPIRDLEEIRGRA